MKRNKKKSIMIIILSFVLILMGVGYAALSQKLTIKGTAKMQGTWDIKITSMELVEEKRIGMAKDISHSYTNTTAIFESKLYAPGDSIEYEVTVENQGNIDAVLKDIIQTKTNKDKNLKFSNSLIGTEVLTSGSKMSFTMKVEIPEEAETLPEVKESKYEIQLIYIQYNGGEYTPPTQSIGTLAERILADNTALPDTNIDFSEISSDTNGKGLYYTNKNTEDNKTTYYFRGDVTNNYVKFATQTRNTCTYNGKSVAYYDSANKTFEYNPTEAQCLSTNICTNFEYENYGYIVGIDENTEATCSSKGGTVTTNKATFTSNVAESIMWRIVRINEDGSVRLVTEDPVGSSKYNNNLNDNAYVGYMYGTLGASTYEETHKNTNNSTIKNYLDNWYNTNLGSYTSYMSTSAGFCNDRSLYDNGEGYGTEWTYYGGSNRGYETHKPQFKCPQTNDLFTITTSQHGNKLLTAPIGLLTLDELVYGGGAVSTINDNYYLNDNTFYWTMTPVTFISASDTYGAHLATNDAGYTLQYYSNYSLGVRPVINLSDDVEVVIGDGTKDSPYVVK